MRKERRLTREQRAYCAEWGLIEKLANDVERRDRDDMWRPARLSRVVVRQALRGIPKPKRESVAKDIADGERDVVSGQPLGSPFSFRDLNRHARQYSALAPIAARLGRQAVRNELAWWRHHAALWLLYRLPKPKDPSSSDVLDVDAIFAHHNRITMDPILRARNHERHHLSELFRWTEVAIAALDAGADATYAVAQAFNCKLNLVGDKNEALYHKAFELPSRNMKAASRARHLALKARDAAIRADAIEVWNKHPTWGAPAVARRLCENGAAAGLSERHVRRIVDRHRRSLAT